MKSRGLCELFWGEHLPLCTASFGSKEILAQKRDLTRLPEPDNITAHPGGERIQIGCEVGLEGRNLRSIRIPLCKKQSKQEPLLELCALRSGYVEAADELVCAQVVRNADGLYIWTSRGSTRSGTLYLRDE